MGHVHEDADRYGKAPEAMPTAGGRATAAAAVLGANVGERIVPWTAATEPAIIGPAAAVLLPGAHAAVLCPGTGPFVLPARRQGLSGVVHG